MSHPFLLVWFIVVIISTWICKIKFHWWCGGLLILMIWGRISEGSGNLIEFLFVYGAGICFLYLMYLPFKAIVWLDKKMENFVRDSE